LEKWWTRGDSNP